jgi:hypothetical protein
MIMCATCELFISTLSAILATHIKYALRVPCTDIEWGEELNCAAV